MPNLKPIVVLKCVGPKLVPFFKTVAIYGVLYGQGSTLESIVYCMFKCLPCIALMIFVLLHGMNFSEAYAYSRKIMVGLFFSMLGDAFMVWKTKGYFIHGLLMFAVAQACYSCAFGMHPLKPRIGAVCYAIGAMFYMLLLPGMEGSMVFFALLYCCLIMTMAWRAIARVHLKNDLWTWTKLSGCVGAVSFVISDLTIAIDKFSFPVPYAHQIIMATYYLAQLGIGVSVVDSQVDALVKPDDE